MNLEKWLEFYTQILKDFNFSKDEDELAAVLMYKLGKEKLLDSSILLEKIKGEDVMVIGPILTEGDFEKIKKFQGVRITAGKALIEVANHITPEIHVTDMEEDVETLLKVQKRGCTLVLHAHGDNIDRIKSIVPKIENFIGTTQSIPFDRIHNFGGFTDGDRAVCMAKEMGAKSIKLIGFDFERAHGIKKRKLEWAKKILTHEGIIHDG
ncbi:hypothetical protein DRP07_03440 [Archaeoglobales archaeon]|nr:MAG: hypothetical protein DRP07_03440 [Archaeoglobales archaeon]